MHQPHRTVAHLTGAQARHGSTTAFDTFTHRSEGTTSMARQYSTHAYSRDVAIQRGGGRLLA